MNSLPRPFILRKGRAGISLILEPPSIWRKPVGNASRPGGEEAGHPPSRGFPAVVNRRRAKSQEELRRPYEAVPLYSCVADGAGRSMAGFWSRSTVKDPSRSPQYNNPFRERPMNSSRRKFLLSSAIFGVAGAGI